MPHLTISLKKFKTQESPLDSPTQATQKTLTLYTWPFLPLGAPLTDPKPNGVTFLDVGLKMLTTHALIQFHCLRQGLILNSAVLGVPSRPVITDSWELLKRVKLPRSKACSGLEPTSGP